MQVASSGVTNKKLEYERRMIPTARITYDSFTYNLAQYLGQMGQQLAGALEIDADRMDEIEEMAPERRRCDFAGAMRNAEGGAASAFRRSSDFMGKIPIFGRVPGASGDWRGVWRARFARRN